MRRLPIIIMLAALLSACSGRGATAPVPRPVACPRITDPGSVYAALDSLPVHIEVNAAALVTRPRPGWVNIVYPALHATVHLTVTPVTDADRDLVVANRTERMALNIADGAPARRSEISSADFRSLMVASPESRTTPLQFVADDGRAWVVSGTVFFSDAAPDSPIDSLAPAVGYVERDLIHTLTTLSRR